MPLLPTAPVRIQPYFGYRSRDRLIVTARALRARADDFADSAAGPANVGPGRWRALRTMIAQFASHEVSGLPVELEIAQAGGTTRHRGVTDGEGYVRFDIPMDPARDYAAQPMWESVTFHWRNRLGAQSTTGHVLAPGHNTALAVISDIDDTIIETGITGGFRSVLRNWRRILIELPQDRLLVPQADLFYAALGGGLTDATGAEGAPGERHPATRRPFFYISSSPWNLYSYLVAFKRGRGLPLGPVLLRDWGLNRATFGSGSHGDHKRAAIDRLLAIYPDLKFALVGDDTQGDLAAYAGVVAAYPDRIRAVFIRTLGEAMTAQENAAKATIDNAGVPLWLGGDYADGQRFLASAGLLHDEDAQRIVAAVEQATVAKK